MMLQVELDTVSEGGAGTKVGVVVEHCVLSTMICAGPMIANCFAVKPICKVVVICRKTHKT